MKTDITELAQNLKAAAEKAEDNSDPNMFVQTIDILALVEALEKAQAINAAAEKLVRCKGRYHSEQNYRALAALFGVMTPDLPPLDSESRTVTVKLPDYRHERFWDSRCEEFNPVEYQAACIEMWREEITAAGIKWEAE